MTVKATMVKSGRKAAPTRKVAAKRSIRVREAEKPAANVKIRPKLETRIKDIAGPKIDDEAALMELKDVENGMMAQNLAVGDMSKSVVDVEKELHMLTTLFMVALSLGSVGVVLMAGTILRLTGHI